MSGTHKPSGGFPPPLLCNCACQRCLEGGCCMVPGTWTIQPQTTVTTSNSVVYGYACTSSGHDFAPYPTGGLFCRKCGEFRQATARKEVDR